MTTDDATRRYQQVHNLSNPIRAIVTHWRTMTEIIDLSGDRSERAVIGLQRVFVLI